MDEWQQVVAEYSKNIAHGFRNLGIEKTADEVRVMIEEEVINAKRQMMREDFYAVLRGNKDTL